MNTTGGDGHPGSGRGVVALGDGKFWSAFGRVLLSLVVAPGWSYLPYQRGLRQPAGFHPHHRVTSRRDGRTGRSSRRRERKVWAHLLVHQATRSLMHTAATDAGIDPDRPVRALVHDRVPGLDATGAGVRGDPISVFGEGDLGASTQRCRRVENMLNRAHRSSPLTVYEPHSPCRTLFALVVRTP